MSNRFHLAIPAGDIEVAKKFYCDVLGCKSGNFEISDNDSWIDIDFWGNELTLHASPPTETWQGKRHGVDMGNVMVPHFGIHLSADDFSAIKNKIERNNIQYVNEPYIRFAGTDIEMETFFIADPNGNVIEIKTMANPEKLFEISKAR